MSIAGGTPLDYLIASGALVYVVALLDSTRYLNDALATSMRLGIERLSLLASTREALARIDMAAGHLLGVINEFSIYQRSRPAR